MTVRFRQRSNIITPTLTYRAHILVVEGYADDTQTAHLETNDGTVVVALTDVDLREAGRNTWRVTGTDSDGNRQTWATSPACACHSPGVSETLAWDLALLA